MNRYLDAVKEFHETFELPVDNHKNNIALKVRQLRIKLLFEELEELATASDCLETFYDLCDKFQGEWRSLQVAGDGNDGDNVDKVEELDALADIQYVLSGAVLSLGYQDSFDNAFEDVQESNMSKLCVNLEEVEDTIQMYVEERGMNRDEISYKPKGDKFIVFRIVDNKILKNKYYKAVDLSKYVE
jgi:predicted HAD superfamily Cof-like phosphohydrolase